MAGNNLGQPAQPDDSVGGRDITLRPVVLLGAGRGGTTLLYKLLALHRDVGFLSNYQHRFPGRPELAWLHRVVRNRHQLKLKGWFKPDGGAYFSSKRDRLQAIVPTPFECESLYRWCGIPLHPTAASPPDPDACRRLSDAFRKVQRWSGASVMLTKRTANNRRIGWLDQAFPEARYIHLIRDGRAVARSLVEVNWWRDHTLFWNGNTPARLVQEGACNIELAACNWIEEIAEIKRGLSPIDRSRTLTLRYEDLLSKPIDTLQVLLGFMGIQMSSDQSYTGAVSSLGLRASSGAWDRGLTEKERESVLQIQSAALSELGYQ